MKLFLSIIIVLMTIPVLLPYLRQGYFPTHDGEWAVVRLADMYRTVRDLQIPARYSGYLNAGYGYPLFNFAYPFPYYIGLIPLLFNIGFVGSIKLLFTLSVPLSALFMYLFSKKLWKSNWAGIISAVVYVYAPYRMVDLFVRGSIGESLAFVIFPLLFYLALKIVEKPKSVYSPVLFSILFALLIGTHNIMTVLFTPLLLLFVLVLIVTKNKQVWRSFLFAFLLGIGLSAFFWLPALSEKHLIWLSETPIADRSLYFVSLQQLVVPSWGYAPPTELGGFSYHMGIAQILIFLLSLGMSLRFLVSKKRTFEELILMVLTGITGIAIFMMFRISSFIWSILPLLKEINYPWIMLSQILFLVAILAGYIAGKKNILKYVMMSLATLAFIMTVSYAKPEEYVDRGDYFYASNDAVTTSSDEYLPLWTKTKPPYRTDQKVEIDGKGSIQNLMYSSKSISFSADLISDSVITVNTIYYPGWEFYSDNVPISITYDNKYGVMQFTLPQGSHHITGMFRETPIRLAADSITVVSVIIIALFLYAKPVQSRILPI